MTSTGTLQLEAGNDIRLTGARIDGGGLTQLHAENDILLGAQAVNMNNSGKGGSIKHYSMSMTAQMGSSVSGDSLQIAAGKDITLAASSVSAKQDASLAAGGSISMLALEGERHSALKSKTKSGGWFSKTRKSESREDSTTLIGSSITAGGNIAMQAGADAAKGPGSIVMQASNVAAKGDVGMKATGNVVVASGTESYSSMHSSSKKGFFSSKSSMKAESGTTNVASTVSGNNVSINAVENVLISGSKVHAENDLGVKAEKGDVVVAAVQDTYWSKEEKKKSGFSLTAFAKSLFTPITTKSLQDPKSSLFNFDARIDLFETSSKKTETAKTSNVASVLTAGRNMAVSAGGDAVIIGSKLGAGNDMMLSAQGDVNILPGATSNMEKTVSKKGSIGIGISLSETNAKVTAGYLGTEQGQKTEQALNARSVVTAGNNLGIMAGENINVMASTVAAKNDLGLIAKDVNILTAQDVTNVQAYTRLIEAGFIAQASQSVTTAARKLLGLGNTIEGAKANKGVDGAISGVKTGVDTINDVKTVARPSASVKLGVGVTYQESHSQSTASTPVLSILQAGRDMLLSAENNILIEGAQMQAGRDMALAAGNDIAIIAAKGTASGDSSKFEANAFGGFGGSVGTGGLAGGWRIEASVAGEKGKNDAITYTNANLYAGEGFTMQAGRDALVAGANIDANNVALDIGRNFTLASVQNDTSKSSSSYAIGGAVTFGYGFSLEGISGTLGLGWGSGSGNLVSQQTSIEGRESLTAKVGEHTHIKGAVLAAGGGNLLLDTGTLSYEDIHAKQTETDVKVGIKGGWDFSANDNKPSIKKPETTGGTTGAGVTPSPSDPTASNGNQNTTGNTGTNAKPTENNKTLWQTISGSPIKPGDIDYTSKNVKQDLLATVGPGTIIVRDAPDTDLSGLNRNQEKTETISTSSTELHIGPIFDTVETISDLFDTKRLGEWYSNFNFSAKDGQVADLQAMIAKGESVPKEVTDALKNIQSAYENNEMTYSQMQQAQRNVVDKFYADGGQVGYVDKIAKAYDPNDKKAEDPPLPKDLLLSIKAIQADGKDRHLSDTEMQASKQDEINKYPGIFNMPDPMRNDDQKGLGIKFDYDWDKMTSKMGW